MKRLSVCFAGMLGALLLSSCYMMSMKPTGGIQLNFGGASAKAISPTATVRVYLSPYSSGNAYSIYTFPGGSTYKDFQYGSGSATITGIPAGLWEVLVSVGTNVNGLLEASSYGNSNAVNVYGGVNSPATITTTAAPPFTYSAGLAGKAINGLAMDYNNYTLNSGGQSLYTSTSGSLYSIPPTFVGNYPVPSLSSAPSQISLPAGLQVSSLALGALSNSQGVLTNCLFVNGNLGIVPFYFLATNPQPTFDTTSFSFSLVDGSGGRYAVQDSAMIVDSTSALSVYYSRGGGFGGVFIDGLTKFTPFNGTTGANWVDIGTTSNGSGNPIYAIAPDIASTNNGFTYFATTFGAFRTGPALITSGGQYAGDLNSVVYFTAPNNATIQAVAIDDYDGLIYIGTPQGAYYAALNETSGTSAINGNWVPITETSGDNIKEIKVDVSAGPYYPSAPITVALRSPSNLYTITAAPTQGGVVATYPLYSGLPGTLTSMEFSLGTLYLGGSTGLAAIMVHVAP